MKRSTRSQSRVAAEKPDEKSGEGLRPHGEDPPPGATSQKVHHLANRQPTEKPSFTIGQLRKAIPPHCFKRSLWRSASYLVTDLAAIAALYFASTFIDRPDVALPFAARWALWIVYWFFQGAIATGVWVISHECGHGAFSENRFVNDGVGLVFHSLLLVPYFSWKHSHRRHHSNTGSVVKDEVFVPEVREKVEEAFEFEWEATWIARLVRLFGTLTIGWPLYLLFNVASRPYPNSWWVNHFDPWSPIFSKRERIEIVISDAALLAVGWCLVQAGQLWGWTWLLKTYFVPYLIVNFWLVTITLLQHTHPALPHYTDAEWDWLRGALATVDRSYGALLDTLHHHIADTHVLHHLFSQIPHYHAEEATKALVPILGDYYKKDSRFFLTALWQDYSLCRYVAPDVVGQGVLWQRK